VVVVAENQREDALSRSTAGVEIGDRSGQLCERVPSVERGGYRGRRCFVGFEGFDGDCRLSRRFIAWSTTAMRSIGKPLLLLGGCSREGFARA
jgi:hypothetical protein